VGEGEVSTESGRAVVTCPHHGWRYDLATGRSLTNPAIVLATYDARVEGGNVVVRERE
jgi:nitrite reductase/ring-hydroxylating ferredoxin subunit